ncbi:phosphatase PAP2/dual specificity phosphatase family protein [Chitinasiproducens palmae]|uniref:Dual specificity phosphatase, catalytic domain n=1 Tax=Chitinasiproducens palmae TaxID=1770053 RepID=A0A1H2PJQ2_9BURK|nr:phosphatase PAP2/dual specificity phosphatase family protein [Chitinasiproducens palmae]SDV46144.1 Dual specificity phosphatase, catalytic domain [Chitinasiproducens palmae]
MTSAGDPSQGAAPLPEGAATLPSIVDQKGVNDAPAGGAGDREHGLFGRALLWLVFLGPFFFASYGFATWYSSRLPSVHSIVYSWESAIPLWPWTIVPYWSIDLLYGLSLLLCASRRELDAHARRLLTAQVICVAGFLLFPLRYAHARPASDGLFGWLFDVLGGFDKPFNQAPSLHIALLVILWVRYAAHLPPDPPPNPPAHPPAGNGRWRHAHRPARWLLHGWFALIGLSVLTTWQHHFIDLPTGALVGWLAVWLWPDGGGTPLHGMRGLPDARRRQLGVRYLSGAVACAAPAAWGGAWLWLLWPASSLALVAAAYLAIGPAAFQKDRRGRLSLAVRWLAPFYVMAAWFNSRAWTGRHPRPDAITDDVWLGRIPSGRDLARDGFAGIVDLCAELPIAPGTRLYRNLPVLDLTAPAPDTCLAAARTIETMRAHGPVLVCCALGYSRSATAVAAWLLLSGRAANVDDACGQLAARRAGIVLGAAQRASLAMLAPTMRDGARSAATLADACVLEPVALETLRR